MEQEKKAAFITLPEYADAVGADVIIAATGARPVKPPIPGMRIRADK